jgi:phage major head subunit gpT-like protein
MEITIPNLLSLNNAVSTAFNSQLAMTEPKWPKFAMETTSTGDSSVYPRLDMIPGMREWFGDRVVNSLSMLTFRVPNRTFESTIGIKRTQIEDDQFSFLAPAAGQLAKNAQSYYDVLLAQLMKAGNSTPSYDGAQNFFDVAHTNYAIAGGVVGPTTAANFVAGANPPWFLLDTSQILKPFFVQKRRPPVLTPKISLTDDNVFNAQEFIWGTDFRGAVSFGIYQYAYMSQATFNMANLVAARNAMKAWNRPDGIPMDVSPNLLVVPSTYYLTAKAYQTSQYDPLAGALTPNVVQGQFDVLENDFLN